MTTTYSEWRIQWLCFHCNHPLTSNQKMYSNGVCPFCGRSSGDTIVDVVERVYRIRTERKNFWRRPTEHREYRKDDD